MRNIDPKKVNESLGKYMLVDGDSLVIDLAKSHGNRVVSAETGNSYLDCFGYIASNPIGHNHPKLFDPVFVELLLRSSRTKPSNPDFSTVEMASFVDTFARIAKPAEFRYLFFVEGGGVAVENALKVAFDWKVRKNFTKGYTEERGRQVIHFQEAFHGRLGYTLSLTNTADPRKTKFFPKFSWPRITNPKVHFPLTVESIAAVAALEQQAEQEIRAAFAANPDDIACIIIEPIQGEGGDNHFRPEFHRVLRTLADEYDALLIYDEVQSGMGLTGKMWAYQHYGMSPDIVAFGKKSQVCGIMAGARIDEVEHHVFSEASRINSTWGGNLADLVRCESFLEIIDDERLIANASEVGAYLHDSLQQLCVEMPAIFSNPRGKGLMCAVDVPTTEKRDQIRADSEQQGLLVLKCGTKSIRFRPALTFSKSEVDEVMTILRRVAANS